MVRNVQNINHVFGSCSFTPITSNAMAYQGYPSIAPQVHPSAPQMYPDQQSSDQTTYCASSYIGLLQESLDRLVKAKTYNPDITYNQQCCLEWAESLIVAATTERVKRPQAVLGVSTNEFVPRNEEKSITSKQIITLFLIFLLFCDLSYGWFLNPERVDITLLKVFTYALVIKAITAMFDIKMNW